MKRSLVWALCAVSLLAASANAQVVISQVYGGGGNAGATLKNDFIELFNAGTTTVSLTGWSVQYTSAAGTTWTNRTNLTGSIAPGGYYLIQQAAGTGGTVNLPTPDATGTIAMSLSAGKVALVSSTTALSGACPSGVVDFVGFGSANCFEGTGPAPTLTNPTAAIRAGAGCTDTNDNAADFSSGTPAPRNSASSTITCGAPAPTNPFATASATPASVLPGASTTLTVSVAPGTNPPSTFITVTADLSPIGGSPAQLFNETATNVFSFDATVALGIPSGGKTIDVEVADLEGRTASATIGLNVESASSIADHVVISQIYTWGGAAGAVYTRDFVELHNPTSESVDLTGWMIRYASAGGTSWTFSPVTLEGEIGPGEYYLVALAGDGSVGALLPDANIGGSINFARASGKVGLFRNGDLVSGACPTPGSGLVDLVGYGSANCSEGDSDAPSPAVTQALLRGNGGAADTNDNGDDFFLGEPNPRRTAPLLDAGPSVTGTEPRFAEGEAPFDSSVTVFFSEPVTLDPAWFSISCASTGDHADVTIATSGTRVVLTPNVAFEPGEQCTVRLVASRIRDEDTNDSRPGTDTLAADYVWSFTIAAAVTNPHAADVHLTMGNPSNAEADVDAPLNFLMIKPDFALSYNRDRGQANWVSWHLSADWTSGVSRIDIFRPDPAIPPDWYRVQGFDFSGSGFDRGHVVPSADRLNSRPSNQATFLMTNMMPQAPGNNQGPWEDFESYLRTIVGAGHELYVVAGGTGNGGVGTGGFAATVANGNVTVPAFTWKVALVLPDYAGDDVARVKGSTKTLAVIMPNADSIRGTDWRSYLTNVDAVEAMTGFDFFGNVRDAAERAIEAGVEGDNPPATADQSVAAYEDAVRTFELAAESGSDGPLTVSVLSSPAHGTLELSGISATYTPAPEFSGTDSFTYTVQDGEMVSNDSTVSIAIREVNDLPVAAPDAKSTGEATALVFAASDLIANDTAGPANESAQTLTVTAVTATASTHGTVSLNGTDVVYTPEAGFAGTASFTYTVCDDGTTAAVPDSQCATSTVTVTVVDSTPPQISTLTLSRTSLWPANHKMVDVTVSYTVTDSADPAPVCVLTVSSNEPENGTGDGDMAPDWEVVDSRTVRLRAERAGTGDGRVYTIALACSDESGNLASQMAQVTVPVSSR